MREKGNLININYSKISVYLQTHCGGHCPPQGPLSDMAKDVDFEEVGTQLQDPVVQVLAVGFWEVVVMGGTGRANFAA